MSGTAAGTEALRIDAVGDRCLLVGLGTTIDQETSARVFAFVRRLQEQPIPGVRDIVPAFTTVALHYQPELFGAAPFDTLRTLVHERLAAPLAVGLSAQRSIEVPVCYGGEFGPDLDDVAARRGLAVEQVIALHLQSPHRVYMLGFAPGFPFIGGLDAALEMPRRASPRTHVPPGSVAHRARPDLHLSDRDPRRLEPDRAHTAAPVRPGRRAPVPDGAGRCRALRPHRCPGLRGPVAGAPMSSRIDVLKPGVQSQLQDLGRYGHQHLGVPVGGAMDEWSHRLANLIAGNPNDEATLEIVLMGPSLKFESAAQIAITGAELSPRLNGEPVAINRRVAVPAGAQLDFGRRIGGLRAYLAVQGGFAVEPVMGSRSTYVRGGFGGFQGRALRKGDVLETGAAAATGASAAASAVTIDARLPSTDPAAVTPLRVVAGEHLASFSAEAQALLHDAVYKISPQSDRMGYRLDGPALERSSAVELISEAMGFGTIQVPADRPADRADGRTPQHRRLSEDRARDQRRPAAAGAAGAAAAGALSGRRPAGRTGALSAT